MSTTDSTHFDAAQSVHAVLPPGGLLQPGEGDLGGILATLPKAAPQRAGYGLPCAKCKLYYSASLAACPVCSSPERVSPVSLAAPASSVTAERTPDPKVLEEERERFLREFKSQIFPNQMQINATESFRCSKEESHVGAFEPAAVCQDCYDQLRARVDLAEAALLIDPKEAAQLVYDAVWSDPSDPSKTYRNAAQALLNELRRRAGIPTVLGPFQTLTD
jgi:hypothetical protein